MNLIDLYTRDGQFVAAVPVPPFQVMPEGIVWGERIFFRDAGSGQYREGILWIATLGSVSP
jgi:hypothetical protein